MRLTLIFLFLLPFFLFGQSRIITGKVSDINKNPISLVSISIVGENPKATTDDKGLFVLHLSSKITEQEINLRIYKKGYKIQTALVAISSIPIEITLISGTTKHITKDQSNTQFTPQINVSTNHQTGGIATGVLYLTVPEDKNIPLENNVDVVQVKPNAITFKPKQGTWSVPFVEILRSEQDSINIRWTYNPYGGAESASFSNWSINIKGIGNRNFVRIITEGPPASPSLPYYLIYDKLPSVIIVGDQNDTTKTYIYNSHVH